MWSCRFGPSSKGEVGGKGGEVSLALGSVGTGRVSEHAIGTDRFHPVLTQQRKQHGQRAHITSRRTVKPNEIRGDGKHQRRFEPTGMGIGVTGFSGWRRRTPQNDIVAFVAQLVRGASR
jgi:hypothetical protein